jgi:hypothetical protein
MLMIGLLVRTGSGVDFDYNGISGGYKAAMTGTFVSSTISSPIESTAYHVATDDDWKRGPEPGMVKH